MAKFIFLAMAIAMLLLSLIFYMNREIYPPIYGVITYFILLFSFIHYRSMQLSHLDNAKFINYSMMLMVGKMLLSLFVALGFFFVFSEQANTIAIVFLSLYFSYTGVHIALIMPIVKRNSN